MDFLLSPINSISWTPSASWSSSASLNRYLQLNFSSNPDVAAQLDALNGLYARAYQMLADADQLSGDAGRANLSQSPPQSSDTDVAAIAYVDKTYYQTQTAEAKFQFQVQQIALNQINQGSSLDPDAASAVNTGANNFTLTVGGTGYTLSVTINAGDTNADAISKIAAAIDAANTGVSASVIRGTGAIKLQLASGTGTDQAFSLADLSGNAVTATGINSSTQTAADAKFLLNGTPYLQSGNTVSLEDGRLEVNLTAAGITQVTTGLQSATALVQSLTEKMSSFGSFVEGNSYLAAELAPAWTDLVAREAGILSKYGLEAGSQGQVGLDTLKFTQALQRNPAQAADHVSDLASRVRDFVKDLTSYPAVNLLASPPTSGYGAAYLRSAASAPWYQPGAGGFWRAA